MAPKALDLERRIFSRFAQEELNQFEATLRKIDEIVLGTDLMADSADLKS